MIDHQAIWKERLHEEHEGYEQFLIEQINNGFADIGWRMDKATPLVPMAEEIVSGVPFDKVRLLEVGTGPLSVVGYIPKCGKPIEFVYTDPMAAQYEAVMHRLGLPIVNRVQPVIAENLVTTYGPESFETVFCCNALDHVSNALIALLNVVMVLKPLGRGILCHFEKEAERCHWNGLHQWNFYEERGEFWIADREMQLNISKSLQPYATIGATTEKWGDGINRVITRIHKNISNT